MTSLQRRDGTRTRAWEAYTGPYTVVWEYLSWDPAAPGWQALDLAAGIPAGIGYTGLRLTVWSDVEPLWSDHLGVRAPGGYEVALASLRAKLEEWASQVRQNCESRLCELAEELRDDVCDPSRLG